MERVSLLSAILHESKFLEFLMVRPATCDANVKNIVDGLDIVGIHQSHQVWPKRQATTLGDRGLKIYIRKVIPIERFVNWLSVCRPFVL